MSSNQPIQNIITRANYEEYFLLYVDNELSAGERSMVAAFAALHPDLKEELDILLSTQLPAEEYKLDKDFLLADTIKITVEEEKLLLLVDGELAGKEKEALLSKINSSPELQLQHHLLLQTKSDRSESISYPNKAELYHNTKAIRPVFWLRIAAAIIVMLCAAWIFWLSNNGAQSVDVATLPVKEKNQQTVPVAPLRPMQEVQEQSLATANNLEIGNSALNDKKKKDQFETAFKKPLDTQTNTKTELVVAVQNIKQNTVAAVDVPEVNQAPEPQQNINTQAVTTAVTASYQNTAGIDNDFINAVATTDDKKGRSVRGFLRKATRFIERTTNVNPVNEDNELLIGVVALKLK